MGTKSDLAQEIWFYNEGADRNRTGVHGFAGRMGSVLAGSSAPTGAVDSLYAPHVLSRRVLFRSQASPYLTRPALFSSVSKFSTASVLFECDGDWQ